MQHLANEDWARIIRFAVAKPGPATEPWDQSFKKRKRKNTDDATALLTPPQAARRLAITTEQLIAFVNAGDLRFINIGRGTTKPRYAFSPADLDAFIANRRTQGIPCQFSKPRKVRHISGTTSKSNVVGFMAQRDARLARKPKK